MLFLALFGVSSMVFFAFLYWQATSYLNSSVEHWIQRDSVVYLSSPGEMVQRLNTHAQRDPDGWRPFGLFDASGRFIAGNLPNVSEIAPLLIGTRQGRLDTLARPLPTRASGASCCRAPSGRWQR